MAHQDDDPVDSAGDGGMPDEQDRTVIPASLQPLKGRDPARVASFELLGRLGIGGMGVAYLGRDGDGGLVVVKVVREEVSDDRELRARFQREVEAMRLTAGPRTARLITADLDAQLPYLVLDFVPGKTLAQRVEEQGPLGPVGTLALADELVEALGAIHVAGVVHRDLKPGNVMLSPTGAQIIDFGVAEVTESTALTRTGLVVGSAGWLAPEQVTGDPVGQATDVHAWACVVLYAATGKAPFGSDRTAASMYRVIHEAPAVPAALGEPLATLVRQSLAKDPAARPSLAAIAGALGNPALVPAAARGPVDVLPPPPPTRLATLAPPVGRAAPGPGGGRAWVWALAGVVLVAFLLGASFAAWSRAGGEGQAIADSAPAVQAIDQPPAPAATIPPAAPASQPAATPASPAAPAPAPAPTRRIRPATCRDAKRVGVLVSLATKKGGYTTDAWPRATVTNGSRYPWRVSVVVTMRSKSNSASSYGSGDRQTWGKGYDRRPIDVAPGQSTTASLAESYDRMMLMPNEYVSQIVAIATADNATYDVADCPVEVVIR